MQTLFGVSGHASRSRSATKGGGPAGGNVVGEKDTSKLFPLRKKKTRS